LVPVIEAQLVHFMILIRQKPQVIITFNSLLLYDVSTR